MYRIYRNTLQNIERHDCVFFMLVKPIINNLIGENVL